MLPPMPQQPALAASFLKARCPQCREGKIFKFPAYNILHFADTNDRCPHCHLFFEREPGFFTGAMYTGYAISVATFLLSFLICQFFLGDPALWVYIAFTVGLTFLLAPFNFRYSRVLLLYAFIRFIPAKASDPLA